MFKMDSKHDHVVDYLGSQHAMFNMLIPENKLIKKINFSC